MGVSGRLSYPADKKVRTKAGFPTQSIFDRSSEKCIGSNMEILLRSYQTTEWWFGQIMWHCGRGKVSKVWIPDDGNGKEFLQGGRSWRASGDHQISLTVLAQSACLQIFATKTPYFTIANFCNINVVFFYNFANKICNFSWKQAFSQC